MCQFIDTWWVTEMSNVTKTSAWNKKIKHLFFFQTLALFYILGKPGRFQFASNNIELQNTQFSTPFIYLFIMVLLCDMWIKYRLEYSHKQKKCSFQVSDNIDLSRILFYLIQFFLLLILIVFQIILLTYFLHKMERKNWMQLAELISVSKILFFHFVYFFTDSLWLHTAKLFVSYSNEISYRTDFALLVFHHRWCIKY